MYYFDNSATTKPLMEVLDVFNEYAFIGASEKDIASESLLLKEMLKCNHDIIYTSGSSESNNMAIKGIAYKYKEKGKHIISTKTEHSSVTETLNYLERKGFIIDYVKLNNGIIDLDDLEKTICSDTVLATFSSVNSETGIIQPIEDIASILNKKDIVFHCDMTQSIGKIDIPILNIDLVSVSSHKIGGLKGIGCLLKKRDLTLENLFYGERVYNLGLVKSFTKALSLTLLDIDKKYSYVDNLRNLLVNSVKNISNLHVNSDCKCLPYIVNASFLNAKPETTLHKFESYNIFVSTKSACSNSNGMSSSVYYLTDSELFASSSIRFSFSCYTTKEEIDYLVKIVKKVCEEDVYE